MEVATGNYGDVIRLERYKDKWQLVLCNEYNGEVKPQWCKVQRGPRELNIPFCIVLGATDEEAANVLKQFVEVLTPSAQTALPGSGTPAAPRYNTRRM
jgi:hypothetical protein